MLCKLREEKLIAMDTHHFYSGSWHIKTNRSDVARGDEVG